jgi:hypothetical protein
MTAAVIIGVILIWLISGRVQFTWRISWILAGVALICVSGLAAGDRLMAWTADGLFVLFGGIGHFLTLF